MLLSGNFDYTKFIYSLIQGILKNNDGYICLLDTNRFDISTTTIFDTPSKNGDYTLLSERLLKNRILARKHVNLNYMNPHFPLNTCDVDFVKKHITEYWVDIKKYQHLKDKKLKMLSSLFFILIT